MSHSIAFEKYEYNVLGKKPLAVKGTLPFLAKMIGRFFEDYIELYDEFRFIGFDFVAEKDFFQLIYNFILDLHRQQSGYYRKIEFNDCQFDPYQTEVLINILKQFKGEISLRKCSFDDKRYLEKIFDGERRFEWLILEFNDISIEEMKRICYLLIENKQPLSFEIKKRKFTDEEIRMLSDVIINSRKIEKLYIVSGQISDEQLNVLNVSLMENYQIIDFAPINESTQLTVKRNIELLKIYRKKMN